MKKNYTLFLALVLLINLHAFSQTTQWDFNDSVSGWSAVNYTSIATATPGDTYATVTMSEDPGTATGYTNNNSKVYSTTADMDTSAGGYLAITLQNNTENTRIQIALAGAFINFNELLQNSESSGFNTYYLYVGGHVNWTGIVDDVQIRFKELPTSGPTSLIGTVLIDHIEIVASIPTPPTVERTDFTFDDINDDEGFVGANATLTHAVSGELQIDFTNKFPGITLTNTYHVPFANNLIAVTFNNASNANQIAVKVEDPANQFASSTIVAGSQTVTIDLGDKTSWNGDETTFTLQFKQLSGDPAAPIEHTGTVTIQRIQFYSGSLGIDDVDAKDDVSISIYPNPVKDKLTINTSLAIEKIELFSVLGQKGMVQFGASNTLDTSSLSKGVYILKIHQENDKISTKRFIKN